MQSRGLDPETRLIAARPEAAGEAVADALELELGAPTLYVERLRLADGEPLLLEQVHLPAERFPGLLASDLEHNSLYQLLTERYGTRVVRAREAIEPVLLRGREAQLLGQPPGVRHCSSRASRSRPTALPVEFGRSYVRGDRTRYYVERSWCAHRPPRWRSRWRVPASAGWPARAGETCTAAPEEGQPERRHPSRESDTFRASAIPGHQRGVPCERELPGVSCLIAVVAADVAAHAARRGSASPVGTAPPDRPRRRANAAASQVAPPSFAAGRPALVLLPRHRRGPAPDPDRGGGRGGLRRRSIPGSSLKFEVVTYDAGARHAVDPDRVGQPARHRRAGRRRRPRRLRRPVARPRARSSTSSGYDTSQYDPAAVEFYNTDDGQIGLPFAVYPSMLWYKADLFEEAGLEPPPHEYGAKYTMPDGSEVDWNYDTVKEIAKLLTVDENGNDATSPDFDPEEDRPVRLRAAARRPARPRRLLGCRQPRRRADGTTVEIPEAWEDAWKFWYDGMQTDHTIMTGAVSESEEFSGGGYPFFSGRVAMSENFLWTTYGVADAGTDWDLAAIPSHNGTVTSPLNADTFAIHKDTKNPDAAFAALTYMLDDSSDELLQLYGGMPARPDKQDAFFETLGQSEGFPDEVDWQVAKDSLEYADNPNFEAPMPKYNETLTILEKYESKWATTPVSTWMTRSRRSAPRSRRPGTARLPEWNRTRVVVAVRPAIPRRGLDPDDAPGAPRGAPGAPLHQPVDHRLRRVHARPDGRDAARSRS